jgi:hypothetical protein
LVKNNDVNRGCGSESEADPKDIGLKRIGKIYESICSVENLELADKKARKGKGNNYGIRRHDKKRAANILRIRNMLLYKKYISREYDIIKIFEPKERDVYRCSYYPHRIIDHAILNYLENVFTKMFTADTYSCVKGKGIHGAFYAVKRALRDVPGTQYCLKLDIRKFYPNVDHDILKQLLRRKIKDNDLLWLLDVIIDSAPGLPIGNYLSQYLANFYLTGFDHWLKEVKRVKYYFRYADDLVILSPDKESLHQLLTDITSYLKDVLRLEVKNNHQVFPVDVRGLDFVGYVFRHTHIRVRKRIKQSCARKLKKSTNPYAIASYNGFLSHGNCRHLKKTLLLYEQMERPENTTASRRTTLCGKEERHGRSSGPRNRNTRLPDRTIEISEQRLPPMLMDAD